VFSHVEGSRIKFGYLSPFMMTLSCVRCDRNVAPARQSIGSHVKWGRLQP